MRPWMRDTKVVRGAREKLCKDFWPGMKAVAGAWSRELLSGTNRRGGGLTDCSVSQRTTGSAAVEAHYPTETL